MRRSFSAALVLALASITVLGAQDRRVARVLQGDLIRSANVTLSDAVFANAPFSADAVTTVTQTLADGTRIEQRTTAKWYRDSTGRVRREQTVIGLDRLSQSGAAQTTITFDSVPGDPSPYTLNPTNKTARRAPRGVQWLPLREGTYQLNTSWSVYRRNENQTRSDTLSGIQGIPILSQFFASAALTAESGLQRAPVPSDIKSTEEQLGTRQVEGVKATGFRSTTVIPAGRIGNDRAIQIVSEQWESPELNMVISSRFSDPRTGVVEYRLTNITRAEPRADLFTVPAGYTEIGNWQPAQNGQPGGARGGRGN